MRVLIILGLTVVITSVIMSLIFWTTHISMTRQDNRTVKWIGYRTFKRYFNYYEWFDIGFSGSMVNREHDCYFHASIIRIGGKGFCMNNPISYFLACYYVRWYSRHKQPVADELMPTGVHVKQPDGTLVFIKREELYLSDRGVGK